VTNYTVPKFNQLMIESYKDYGFIDIYNNESD